jgi:hypothetical protein
VTRPARFSSAEDLHLAVLNPGGRDPRQAFPDGAGPVDDAIHAPVNYHAYAACTAGEFDYDAGMISSEIRHVLLLVRSDMGGLLKSIDRLRAMRKKIAISFKESGSHQVAAALDSSRKIEIFREACCRAYSAVASTPDLVPLYRSAGAANVAFIPTPYPVDEARWDFSIPIEQRDGIFVGTREFDIPSRNHLAALLAARGLSERFGTRVTVSDDESRSARRRIDAVGFKNELLNVIEGRLPYSEYLRLMAQHRIVFQLDRSAVPGQVAGDALLCRLPCVGGDGAIERVAFSRTCGHGRDNGDLVEIAGRLLRDDTSYVGTIEGSQATASTDLSFRACAWRLTRFFAAVPSP